MVVEKPQCDRNNREQQQSRAPKIIAAGPSITAAPQCQARIPACQRERSDHCCFLCQARKRKQQHCEPLLPRGGILCFEVVSKSPQRQRSRRQISVGQRALRKPHRKNCGAEYRRYRHRHIGQKSCQAKDRGQRQGSDQQHGNARHRRLERRELPPEGKIDAGQRRVSVGERRVWNQLAILKKVIRRRNVVAGLVPEVGKAQQRRVQQENRSKDQREYLQSTDAGKGRRRGRSNRAPDHLVHRTTCSCHVGIQLDLAEGLLVLPNILAQDM